MVKGDADRNYMQVLFNPVLKTSDDCNILLRCKHMLYDQPECQSVSSAFPAGFPHTTLIFLIHF